MNIESIIVKMERIDWRDVPWLQPDEFKEISKERFEKLKASIKQKGFAMPFLVWDSPKGPTILDGVHRKRAMLELAEEGHKIPTKLPATFVKCKNRKQALELMLTYSSVYARATEEQLYELIVKEEIDFSEIKEVIDLPDFNMKRFELGYMTDEVTENEVPPLPEIARTMPGDLYELGEHRLLCGDATNTESVRRLMQGREPLLMVTDPPYGVNYDPEWRVRAGANKNPDRMGRVTNDDRVDWSECFRIFNPQIIYLWHGGVHTLEVGLGLEKVGYQIISQIIWVKNRFALSRGDYHWQHEPCFYAVRDGSPHDWQGARDQSTTWMIDRPERNEEAFGHSTQKPIECMLRPIQNNSKPGDLVVDPFLGTGTTLIAAQHLGRVCYGMEVEPKYCDVIVQRYLDFTQTRTLKLNSKEIEWPSTV